MNATDSWPLVLKDRCETNFVIPGIAEFWSAATGFAIVIAGLLPLLASKYTDDELDLVSATVVANGIAAVLAHGTNLRIFGRADALTINVGALLYTKAYVLAIFPQLCASPFRRAIINLLVVLGISVCLAWNEASVPAHVFRRIDISNWGLIPCFGVVILCSFKLLYGDATWHHGPPKRVFLRGTFIFIISWACWCLNEAKLVIACPAPISLHVFWHLGAAHALLAWMAFLRYHRGLFFGFRPEVRGWWWCPFTVWRPPIDAMSNQIIRHSQSRAAARESGRRNSYTTAKLRRPSVALTRAKSLRQVWRGESFYGGRVQDSKRVSRDHAGIIADLDRVDVAVDGASAV